MVASPYANKLAREAGVDIGAANGSGPNGRIVAADVEELIKSGAVSGAGEPHGASRLVQQPVFHRLLLWRARLSQSTIRVPAGKTDGNLHQTTLL